MSLEFQWHFNQYLDLGGGRQRNRPPSACNETEDSRKAAVSRLDASEHSKKTAWPKQRKRLGSLILVSIQPHALVLRQLLELGAG